MNSKQVVWLACLLAAVTTGWADGLIRDGHPFGPYTSISLTPIQVRSLNKGATKIELTHDQHDRVTRATGSHGPKSIHVLPSDYDDCACELTNVGVRVASDKVEISHLLYDGKMFRDSEKHDASYWAEKRRIERRTEDAELARVNLSPESKIYAEGIHLSRQGNYVAAAQKFREAHKVNPRYGPARRQVARQMSGTAWNALVDHEDDGLLLRRYREIFEIADPEDTDTLDAIRSLIEDARRRLLARKWEAAQK